MLEKIRGAVCAAAIFALSASGALAAEYTVNMLNKGEDGTMVFEPVLTEIAVGDTVTFVATDKSHNAESIKGLIPEGAESFKGKVSKDVTVTFDVPGVYAIKCLPHYTMGMVALVAVGDDLGNLADVEDAKWPKIAAKRLAPAFETLNAK